jgi:hypothetical protein
MQEVKELRAAAEDTERAELAARRSVREMDLRLRSVLEAEARSSREAAKLAAEHTAAQTLIERMQTALREAGACSLLVARCAVPLTGNEHVHT